MALALFDRVQETTTTTGTGSITLAGAVSGFQSFAVVGNGNTCYYTIVDGSAWEVGVGTYSTSGPTLARTTILSNSNGNTTAITLAAGTKSVFLTYPASKSVNLNESGNVSALGTVSSGTWQGSTIGVAYGGTGVTASTGANSVVLRDANGNITVNRISQELQTITASGGTTVLTAASDFNQQLVGTGGQTFRLPDATTLTDTTAFQFNNNATGTLTIQNNASAVIGTVAPGGAAGVALMSNATVAGTWDVHGYIPENVTWGTNALALGTTVISGGTWQGGTIQSGYGGTGLTTFAGANNALYSTSASALAAGTLPIAAGGTGQTTRQAAMDALAGSVTSGQYLRGDGTDVVMSAIQAADVPTLNQNTTGSAATLATGRTISITGDLAYTSPSFNGSTNVTASGTLATVNTNVGSFTNASLTVNAKGLITAASSGTAPVTSVTGTSPVTSSGGTTPAIGLASGYGDTQNPYASKTANFVLAAPNGASGVPTFRAVVASDIPTLNQNTTGTSSNVTGTVAFANGGTGETTRQSAMDALAGAVTSGQYLRGNGTDVVMSAIQAADVPTLNQNTTGTASNVTGIVAVVNGGTGTATPALVAGTNVTISGTWPNQTINSTGGGGGTSSPIPKLQSWSIGAM